MNRSNDPLAADQSVHLSGYQNRDFEVVDYKMEELLGTGLKFRGPFPEDLDRQGSYFACIGAAQTLGCFCQKAFPDIVSEKIDLPALNLGYGGAGPEFFLNQRSLIPYLNRAKFVVVQVMSARSQSNSIYECGGLEYVTMRADGRKIGAHAAWDDVVIGPRALKRLPMPWRVRRKLGNLLAKSKAKRLVAEAREAWMKSSFELFNQIEVPIILFWFSKRPTMYRQLYGTGTILGEFPHLIDTQMIGRLKPEVTAYVECVSQRGSPQKLYSRFTGQPISVNPSNDRPDLAGAVWHENFYYPSPEMHEDVAEGIIDALDGSSILIAN